MTVALSNPQTTPPSALPPEFTLHLGPDSITHVAAMARILEQLGAQVDIDPAGALVAVRPNE